MNWTKFTVWGETGVCEATYIKLPNGNWALAGMFEPPITKYGFLSVGLDDDDLHDDRCRSWDAQVEEIRRIKEKNQKNDRTVK